MYHPDSRDKILKIYEKLKSTYKVCNVNSDNHKESDNIDCETQKIEGRAKTLKKSKLILVCLIRSFFDNIECVKEFIFVAKLRKDILVIKLENSVRLEEMQKFEFIANSLKFLKCDTDIIYDWSDEFFHILKDKIEEHFRVHILN